MVLKRLRRKGDAASAPPPKSAAASAPPPKSSAPGSTKSDKVKKKGVKPDPKKLFKKKGVKPDPKKLKGSCIESAGIAEASASAPTPAPKPVETKPAVAAAGTAVDRPALSKTEDKKATRKETMKGKEEKKGEGSNGNTGDRKVMKGREEKVEGEGSKTGRKETVKGREEKGEGEGKKMSRKETVKGREEKGEGSGSKTSRKEMMEGREEERMKREEKRRKTTGKEKEEEESGSGFIFMCSARTKPECYRNGVFGLPRGKMDVVEKIRPGVKLFLYDFDLKLMYGVYKADTRGGLDIVRHAFDGKFPAQVKFSVDLDCLPIPESSFKHAIKENYTSKGRFTQELSSKQVQRLLALFQPIGLSQPAPQHIEEVRRSHIVEVEDRRKPSYDEERRQLRHIEEMSVPINHHAYALGDDYMIARSLRRPLLDEPRRSLVLDPYHIQESHHAPPTYYHQVATSSPYHQPHMDIMHERTAAEATVRDPLVARDYGALPGELAARSERVDELYRSYKLSTSALDLNPRPSYGATYEYPTSVYREGSQRPVVTRVNGPSVPVSTRYSFAGPPAY